MILLCNNDGVHKLYLGFSPPLSYHACKTVTQHMSCWHNTGLSNEEKITSTLLTCQYWLSLWAYMYCITYGHICIVFPMGIYVLYTFNCIGMTVNIFELNWIELISSGHICHLSKTWCCQNIRLLRYWYLTKTSLEYACCIFLFGANCSLGPFQLD